MLEKHLSGHFADSSRRAIIKRKVGFPRRVHYYPRLPVKTAPVQNGPNPKRLIIIEKESHGAVLFTPTQQCMKTFYK